jgi:hypothetical protein
MTRTREGVWFFAILGFGTAVSQLLMVRNELWPKLGLIDWFILSLLFVAPLFAVWRYFRDVPHITDAAWQTGFRLALGGYIPLWFGLSLVRRILNG